MCFVAQAFASITLGWRGLLDAGGAEDEFGEAGAEEVEEVFDNW